MSSIDRFAVLSNLAYQVRTQPVLARGDSLFQEMGALMPYEEDAKDREWDFGREVTLLPSRPGRPFCRFCGAPAPEGIPGPYDRCAVCHRILHTCYNCAFYDGLGCLLLLPYVSAEHGLPGQHCPEFRWHSLGLPEELTR